MNLRTRTHKTEEVLDANGIAYQLQELFESEQYEGITVGQILAFLKEHNISFKGELIDTEADRGSFTFPDDTILYVYDTGERFLLGQVDNYAGIIYRMAKEDNLSPTALQTFLTKYGFKHQRQPHNPAQVENGSTFYFEDGSLLIADSTDPREYIPSTVVC